MKNLKKFGEWVHSIEMDGFVSKQKFTNYV